MERATGFALLLLLLACVTATQVQAQACRWDGTAPFCDGECGADESDTMRSAVGGPGIDRIESVNRFGNDCATGTKARLRGAAAAGTARRRSATVGVVPASRRRSLRRTAAAAWPAPPARKSIAVASRRRLPSINLSGRRHRRHRRCRLRRPHPPAVVCRRPARHVAVP